MDTTNGKEPNEMPLSVHKSASDLLAMFGQNRSKYPVTVFGHGLQYLMGDSESVCGQCIQDESNPIVFSPVDGDDPAWTVIAVEIVDDGEPVTCANCERTIS